GQAQSDLEQYQTRMQGEGQKMQTRGLQGIEAALGPVFEKLRKDGGYDLILNNTPGVVIMVGERVDITPLVIARTKAAARDGGR
ncbi:MAG: OmpH family outer membrane protein, partial [Akkermansiaceae bacterium]|nr:OmpH family outer membrane protein [Akkermansiaceae bacterium]